MCDYKKKKKSEFDSHQRKGFVDWYQWNQLWIEIVKNQHFQDEENVVVFKIEDTKKNIKENEEEEEECGLGGD